MHNDLPAAALAYVPNAEMAGSQLFDSCDLIYCFEYLAKLIWTRNFLLANLDRALFLILRYFSAPFSMAFRVNGISEWRVRRLSSLECTMVNPTNSSRPVCKLRLLRRGQTEIFQDLASP